MDLSYEIVPYADNLRDAYGNLLPEQTDELDRGKLDWKFRDNPAGTGLIALARHDRDVLGLNGFMPARFEIEGEELIGYQSMDTIVTSAARGQGVFGRMIERFYDETRGALLYGFPNESSAVGFFGKLEWTSFGIVPMLVRPLSTGPLKRFSRAIPSLPLPVWGARSAKIKQIDSFGEGATAAWARFAEPIGCAVKRDADYLNWRLKDNPAFEYMKWTLPDGSFAADIVLDKHDSRIGYLMEAVGPSDSLLPLVAHSLRRMKSAGAQLAFAWCSPWSPNYRTLRRLGFLPFPQAIRPIKIFFGARRLRATSDAVTDPAKWYVSYLDSDTV